jgi:hypothetical protein
MDVIVTLFIKPTCSISSMILGEYPLGIIEKNLILKTMAVFLPRQAPRPPWQGYCVEIHYRV